MKLHVSDKLSASTLVLAASIFAAAGAAPAFAADQPDHIFFIMMENHATSQIIGNTADAPFINQLAHRYSVATNYHGVTHPSLPNYLAAISGDFQGIFDDCKAGMTVTCPPEEIRGGRRGRHRSDILALHESQLPVVQSRSPTAHPG